MKNSDLDFGPEEYEPRHSETQLEKLFEDFKQALIYDQYQNQQSDFLR